MLWYDIEAENYANIDISKIEKWAKNNKITFNESKSTSMLVSRKRTSTNKNINIYINYERIKQVQEIKYLGIHFNNKLRFDKHIELTANKAMSLINMLRRAARMHWGLGHSALKTIYNGAILPMITYGAPVWEDALRKQKNLNKLKRVQRIINVTIAKAYKTLPYEASCVIAGIKPLAISIHETAQIYRAIHSHTDNLTDIDAPLKKEEWPHPAERITVDEVEESNNYKIEIFTDGSKLQGMVGAAAVIIKNGQILHTLKAKLSNHCSNNQAEQIGILKALQAISSIDQTSTEERLAAVYTDSQATLDLLKNNFKQGHIITEIRQLLGRLREQKWTIHFGWIKAHAGNQGNEMADKLAKEAAVGNSQSVFTKKPKTSIITQIKEEGTTKWQNEWNNAAKGTTCKKFFPSVRERLKLKWDITPEFSAMVTGHGKNKSHLHRIGILNDPTCPCQKAMQTVDHLLYDCEMQHQARNTMKEEIRKAGGTWPVPEKDFILKYSTQFKKYIRTVIYDKV